jgi:LacI family transcriptional regulator
MPKHGHSVMPISSLEKVPKVAIVLFAGVIAQDILRGIARYVRSHRPWHVFLELGMAIEPTPLLLGWRGDGLISQLRGVRMNKWAKGQHIPKVTTPPLNGSDCVEWPTIDRDAEAALAAEHFYSRGFRNVAFCPHRSGAHWGRQQSFVAAVEALGGHCHLYVPTEPTLVSAPWENQFSDLCNWLDGLPKPIGIFTANDERGCQVIDACRYRALRVPEDVAVLGDDNDQAVCDLCNPPLSSIQRPHEELGYRCAMFLDAMMLKQPIPPQPPLPPVRLILRQSTDVLAVDDPEVASAIRFINHNLGVPFNVKDLMREIPIGRRALEHRFRRAIGRTLGREIRRMRVVRATQLLFDTQLKMPEIARRCGFTSAPRLTEAFRRELGKTPTSYRSRRG